MYLHPMFAEVSQMTVIAAVVAVLFVIFMFIGIWASRYTKVGPNQVLVISGRKHRMSSERIIKVSAVMRL